MICAIFAMLSSQSIAFAQTPRLKILDSTVTSEQVGNPQAPGTRHIYQAKIEFDANYADGLHACVVWITNPLLDANGNHRKDANGKWMFSNDSLMATYSASSNPPVTAVTSDGWVKATESFSGINRQAPKRWIKVTIQRIVDNQYVQEDVDYVKPTFVP